MLKMRWLLALPLAFAAWVGTAQASSIHDEAGIFDPDTIRKAQETLDRVERQVQLPVTIETIDSLQGDSIDEATIQHAEKQRASGVFILIAKKERKIEVRAARGYARAFPVSRTATIRKAILAQFQKGDFNAGLLAGASQIEKSATEAAAENGGTLLQQGPGGGRRPALRHGAAGRQTFGLGSLLGIGLGIMAILFVMRLIGSAFGGGHGGYGAAGRMGPGYGAPGYGGGGGGFLSSMFGGIGGALAGNWLYDQFSGRHHHGGDYVDSSSSYDPGQAGDNGADDWSGGSASSGDWGGGGGGDWGGGGGGGDWGGGGGGDWGGGGGGGGGDW